jgi:hypothetical protein
VRELSIAAIMLSVFAIAGVPIFAVLVGGWLVGWVLVSYFGGLFERTGARIVLAIGAVLGLRALWVQGPAMVEAEGLTGLSSVLADRFRLEETPAIAPAVVHGDRRQRFFVHAPDAEAIAVAFGGARAVNAAAWGHGLFAVDYDPLRDGAPGVESGLSSAIVGGVERPIRVVMSRARPQWICSDGTQAAVISEETDQVFLIDGTGDLQITKREDQPVACAFSESRLVIAHRGEDQTAIAATADEIAIGLGGARTGVAFFAGSGGDRSEKKFAPLAEAPDHLLYAGGALFAALRRAHRLVRIDDGRSLALGRPAITLRKTADERFLIVPVSDHLAEGESGENHEIRDQLLLIDPRTLRVVQAIPRDGGPIGVAATSSAAITVALAGDGNIVNRDVEINLPGAYDVASIDDGLIVATSPALGVIAVFDRAGKQRAWHQLAPQADEGERAFFESTRSRVSCASCHLHADSDLATHDIGHGRASPTLSVRGVAGTSPYLRGASYPTLDSLDTFARTILGGYERNLPARATLLADYVTALPPISPPRPTPNARAGVDAFIKAACDRCHAFPALTNLAQVPASYLFPELGKTDRLLDTPSLLGLATSGPYLDDGRAKTIAAVLLDHNRAERHGDVQILSDEERRALIEFLESL